MNKKIIIIAIIFLAILSIVVVYKSRNAIKEGDIFTNVSIKNDIPKINSRGEAAIGIYNSDDDMNYLIIYIADQLKKPYIGVSISKSKQELGSYRYAWEYIEEDSDAVAIPEGWSEHKTANKYENYFVPIQNLPLEYINGTVTYTKGNTSIIKKILIGL